MEDPLIECIHVPKLLFTDLKYRWMSDFSKLLYSLLMERSRQSVQRGWVDSNKNIYSWSYLEIHITAFWWK